MESEEKMKRRQARNKFKPIIRKSKPRKPLTARHEPTTGIAPHLERPHPPYLNHHPLKPPHLLHNPPHEHALPPHLRHAVEGKNALLKGVVVGSALTLVVGLILFYAGIKIEVVLPVIAPVWVGSITLLYNHWKQH